MVNPQVLAGRHRLASSAARGAGINRRHRQSRTISDTVLCSGRLTWHVQNLFKNNGSLIKQIVSPSEVPGSSALPSISTDIAVRWTSSCPMPHATRCGVPNRLANNGRREPFGFSNSNAGPVHVRCGQLFRSFPDRVDLRDAFLSWLRSSSRDVQKSRKSRYFIRVTVNKTGAGLYEQFTDGFGCGQHGSMINFDRGPNSETIP